MLKPVPNADYSSSDETPSLAFVRQLLDNFVRDLFPDAKYAALTCSWGLLIPHFVLPCEIGRACDNSERRPGRPLSEVLKVLRSFVIGNFPEAEYAGLYVCINPKKSQSEIFEVYSKVEHQAEGMANDEE